MIRKSLILLSLISPSVGLTLPLELPPQTRLIVEEAAPQTDIPFPVSPFASFDPVTDRATGDVERQVWSLSSSLTPLQLMAPLRLQLEAAGYDISFECSDQTCGGFDFRFTLDLIGEPDMHVDLGDYRYLAATRESGVGRQGIAIVTSRSADAGFVHITTVSTGESAPEVRPEIVADTTDDLITTLQQTGRVVLADLAFQTGSAALNDGPFASLNDLAGYLRTTPDATVTLVGHTDAVGALDQNVALSRNRAAAVRERLISRYGVPDSQLRSDGVGFLMPLASNDTEEGRSQNRRVEAVLIPTE